MQLKQTEINERMMIRYLLGDLSEQEQVQLEERYFTDDDCFQQLLALEDELIDDYVRGELAAGDRKLFEQRFLASPERRQKVEFAQALKQTLPLPPKSSWWQALWRFVQRQWLSLLAFLRMVFAEERSILAYALAAGVLILLLGGSWLFVETFGLRAQLQKLEAERMTWLQQDRELQQQITQQREQNRQLSEQLESERSQRRTSEQELAKSPSTEPVMLSFVLMPSSASRGTTGKGEGQKVLNISPAARTVQLQLDLDAGGEYKSYRAALRTLDGEELWSQDMLRASRTDAGKAVFLKLPAAVFREDDYILILKGIAASGDWEEVGSYVFSVVKK
jgi:hypothetical protein